MEKEQRFIEEVGLFFEVRGVPRMTGRMLGWLLICDPPYQSADEIAEALMASKGSISTTTRLLMRLGMIEKISLPGQRRDYFVISPKCWDAIIQEAKNKISEFRALAERGLDVVKDKEPHIRERLETMQSVYSFFEREFESIAERWQQEKQSIQK